MRVFVISDIHGFYDLMIEALNDAGYDSSDPDDLLVVLGDCWDRGDQPFEVYRFLADLSAAGKAYLIKGNHEYMMSRLISRGGPVWADYYNGTARTFDELTVACGMKPSEIAEWVDGPRWHDYLQVGEYVFVHGWIPLEGYSVEQFEGQSDSLYRSLRILPNWDVCKDRRIWEEASWESGVGALKAGLTIPKKTIVCGHRHVSAFHSTFDRSETSEFGPDADFSIFRKEGCIAIDACTAYSHKVNVLVLNLPTKKKEKTEI